MPLLDSELTEGWDLAEASLLIQQGGHTPLMPLE